jgi:hypothetical protein
MGGTDYKWVRGKIQPVGCKEEAPAVLSSSVSQDGGELLNNAFGQGTSVKFSDGFLHGVGDTPQGGLSIFPEGKAGHGIVITGLSDAAGINNPPPLDFLEKGEMRVAQEDDIGVDPLDLLLPDTHRGGRLEVLEEGIGGSRMNHMEGCLPKSVVLGEWKGFQIIDLIPPQKGTMVIPCGNR